MANYYLLILRLFRVKYTIWSA